jgi:hypothetical protein
MQIICNHKISIFLPADGILLVRMSSSSKTLNSSKLFEPAQAGLNRMVL